MQSKSNTPDYSFLSSTSSGKPGPSKKQRMIIVGVGATLLLIAIFIVSSLLFGGGDTKETSLKLAQLHTELIRVSDEGKKNARGQAAKNLATTTSLTLASSGADIIALANKDQKVPNSILKAGKDAATDKTLTTAAQRGQFDEVFSQLLVTEIKEYQRELKKAYDNSKSKKTQEIYSNLYDDLDEIVKAVEAN